MGPEPATAENRLWWVLGQVGMEAQQENAAAGRPHQAGVAAVAADPAVGGALEVVPILPLGQSWALRWKSSSARLSSI